MTITNLDPKPWDANTATPASPNDNRYDYEQGLELNENGWDLEFAPRAGYEQDSGKYGVAS